MQCLRLPCGEKSGSMHCPPRSAGPNHENEPHAPDPSWTHPSQPRPIRAVRVSHLQLRSSASAQRPGGVENGCRALQLTPANLVVWKRGVVPMSECCHTAQADPPGLCACITRLFAFSSPARAPNCIGYAWLADISFGSPLIFRLPSASPT